MELVFIRHGESEANAREAGGFFSGRWDCALTPRGRMQADSLKENEMIRGADAVFCSPLKRAADTAAAFADPKTIIRDARITERTLGDFDGKWRHELENRDEYRKYFTEAEYMLFRNSFTVSPPNGENYGDVVRRVTPFLEELKKSGIRKAVIVSHAIAIRCMLKVVKNLPEEETLRIDVRQCEPIRAEY